MNQSTTLSLSMHPLTPKIEPYKRVRLNLWLKYQSTSQSAHINHCGPTHSGFLVKTVCPR